MRKIVSPKVDFLVSAMFIHDLKINFINFIIK